MSRKKLNTADPTAYDALGNLTREGQLHGLLAKEIRERARLRVAADAARNERIRRLRALAGPDGGDAA